MTAKIKKIDYSELQIDNTDGEDVKFSSTATIHSDGAHSLTIRRESMSSMSNFSIPILSYDELIEFRDFINVVIAEIDKL